MPLSLHSCGIFMLAKNPLGNGTNEFGDAKHKRACDAKPRKSAYDNNNKNDAQEVHDEPPFETRAAIPLDYSLYKNMANSVRS